MILLQDKPNTLAPNGTYPFGNLKNNTGANDGTPVNVEVYADMHQFFEKLFDESGLTASGLPDNQVNGFQLMEAFHKVRADKNPVVGSHSETLPTITNSETTLINDTVLSTAKGGKVAINFNAEITPGSGGGGTSYIVTVKIKVNGIVVNQKGQTVLNDGARHIIDVKHYMEDYEAGDVIKIVAVNSVVASCEVGNADFMAQGFELVAP